MKKFDANFKAKVALEAIKGEKSLEEIARHYQISPSRVSNWKKKILDEIPYIFSERGHSQPQHRPVGSTKFAVLNRERELYRYRLTLYR